jgi:type II restriction enzyme
MKLCFEESQMSYSSGTQKTRAWTEAWVNACATMNARIAARAT